MITLPCITQQMYQYQLESNLFNEETIHNHSIERCLNEWKYHWHYQSLSNRKCTKAIRLTVHVQFTSTV